MSELYASPSFGIALTVLVYWVGVKIQKKTCHLQQYDHRRGAADRHSGGVSHPL